jgi:hypothetical protein
VFFFFYVISCDKNTYSKIQQVLKDTARVTQDSRVFLKEKTEDGTLGDTAQHAANLLQDFVDQSWETLDKLWTNWAALLTVVAAGSAGSWKQILEQSGRVISDLRYTEDFVKLLGDLRQAFYALSQHLQKVLNFQICFPLPPPPPSFFFTKLTCSTENPR